MASPGSGKTAYARQVQKQKSLCNGKDTLLVLTVPAAVLRHACTLA